jgi:hypothetical protein
MPLPNDNDLELVLVDSTYQPPDPFSAAEVRWTLRLQTALNLIGAGFQGLVTRPGFACGAWSFWLAMLYFCCGTASYVKMPDCGNGTLPARQVFAQEWLAGELGNWMPQSGCGIDRVVNNYRLEPQCLLLGLLPGWLGYGLIMWLQRFLAAYGMWRLSRDDLSISPAVALLLAWSYSLFSQIGIHWQWDGFTLYDGLGIPGLPMLFWLTNRLATLPTFRALSLALVLGVALGLTAPFFQTIFFPFLALFWYCVIQPGWNRLRWLVLTSMFVGWAIIAAPEMGAAAKYVPHSHRSEIKIHRDSAYVKHIENVELWAKPVWTANKHYLLAALAGFICIRWRDRSLTLTLLAIGGVLFFVRNYYTCYDHTLAHLGFLASFHFHRLIYLLPFLCVIAMGLGLMRMPRETSLQLANRWTGLKLYLRPLLLLCLFLSVSYQSVQINRERWRKMGRGESYAMLYAHPDLLALAEANRQAPEFRIACVTDLWRPGLGMHESDQWSISPGVCWAYGFETTDGYQVLYSQRYKHYWTQVLHPLLCQDVIRSRQHLYWGNMLFLWHPARKAEDLVFKDHYRLPLLSLANTRFIVSPVPLEHGQLKLLPSAFRDEYLSAQRLKKESGSSKASPTKQSPRGLQHRPLYIYENLEVMPRSLLATQVKWYDDEYDLLADLRTADAESLRTTIRLLKADAPPELPWQELQGGSTASPANGIRCVLKTNDAADYEIETTQPCLFFLSNAYHPAWQATLNEQATTIIPAQLAFQAIFIPAAGKHRLQLRYRPLYSAASYLP